MTNYDFFKMYKNIKLWSQIFLFINIICFCNLSFHVSKNLDQYQNKKMYKYKQNKEIAGQISFHVTCLLSAMFDVLRVSSTNKSAV